MFLFDLRRLQGGAGGGAGGGDGGGGGCSNSRVAEAPGGLY